MRTFVGGLAWVTLLFVVFMRYGTVPDTVPVLPGDSEEYVLLAETILNGTTFSFSPGEIAHPDSFRTPGYPLFIAGVIWCTGSIDVVIVVQLGLVALVGALLYQVGGMLFDERVARLATMLWFLNPLTYFAAFFIWSDFFFTAMLFLSLVGAGYANGYDDRRKYWVSALSGLLFGYAILVRPIVQFIPLLIVVAGVLVYTVPTLRARLHPTTFRSLATWLVAVCVVVTPWMVRNYHTFGVIGVSSVSSFNVLYYNLTEHAQYEGTLPYFETLLPADVPMQDLSLARSFVYQDVYEARIASYLHEHWFSYLIYHGLKTVPFFLANSYLDIAMYLNRDAETTYRTAHLSTYLLQGDLGGFVSFLYARARAGDVFFFLFVLNMALWAVLFASVGLALWRGWKLHTQNMTRVFLVVTVFLTLYFAGLTGPVATPRYRLPIEPYVLVAASAGLVFVYDWVRRRRTLRVDEQHTT